jgi:hypothetical protein
MNICMYIFFGMCIVSHTLQGSFVTLSFEVKVPSKTLKSLPLAPVYLKGDEFPPAYDYINKVSYRIIEYEDLPVIYILVTEDLDKPKDLDIQFLKTAQNYPYRLFKCIRTLQQTTDAQGNQAQPSYTWLIEELDNSTEQLILPDNTLIFFFNPAYIELQSELWRVTDHIVRLPSLVIKDSVDSEELASVALRMICKVPDFRCFHKKLTQTTKVVACNRIISVPNPTNRYAL